MWRCSVIRTGLWRSLRRSKRISGFVKLRSIVYDAFSFMLVSAGVEFAFHVIFMTIEYVFQSPDYCRLGFFSEEIKSEAAFEES